MGSDLKNTFCLLKQNKAIVSQHIGDTANELIQQQLENNIDLFCQIYQFKPDLIAIDAHTGYFSSKVGKNLAKKFSIPYVTVLHHHAHITAVLAEHHCKEKAIGIALDGIGMGANGQLWGGECLLVEGETCQHLGGLPAVALPGGDLAATQPWRNWIAHLQQFVPHWQTFATKTCSHLPWEPLTNAIQRKLNSPLISSAGRLFDAVAYGLGITETKLSWEGEAACHLEALATQSDFIKENKSTINIPVKMAIKNNQLDLSTFWQSWLAYDTSKANKAFAFHYALAQGFSELARKQALYHHCKTIVLSGGVMHNQLLRKLLKENLAEFNVLSAHQYPMGDGGLSLGQAMIVANLSD